MALPATRFEAERFMDERTIKAEFAEFRQEIKADLKDLRDELKTAVRELWNDHKTLLWAGISGFGFILLALAGGYFKLSERDDRLYEKLTEVHLAVERLASARTETNPASTPAR